MAARDSVTCTPSELLGTWKCLQCLSTSELLQVIAYVIASLDYTLPDDGPTIVENSKCFTCLSDKQLLQAIAAKLIDKYVDTDTVDMDALLKTWACMHCATGKQVRAAIVYLLCSGSLLGSQN